MVYYRKYRPQTIEELDSKEVRDKLYTVLGSRSISHAFLFTGPKGLGKTSAARIVAKSLNCEERWDVGNEKIDIDVRSGRAKKSHFALQRQASHVSSPASDIEPCNKCDQCISITNGTNMDILEIDGASNRGIDEIRDLREKVKLSPMSARKKVYIIDEVHMLTQEAFNALLKTLEEPPSHVVFILCTTEPHKVPATIKSRCLHIKFVKAIEEELVRSFERILKLEKIKFDKEALNLIASLSDGSFRDGVKILEEMSIISKDKNITKDLVEKKYQVSSIEYQIAQMIRHLENRDTKEALESVAKLTSEGIEIGHFMQELISALHNSLLFKAGVHSAIQNSEFRIENVKLEIGEIKKLIEMLSKAIGELKYAVLPQLPLELVVVEWGLQARINTDIKADERGSIVQRQSVLESASIIDKAKVVEKKTVSNPAITTQQGIASYSENDALWIALIDKVKAYNHSIAGVLRGCSIKSYDGKNLIIETNFKFHRDKLSEPKVHEILEKVSGEVTKKNITVEVLLKEPAFAKASAGDGR